MNRRQFLYASALGFMPDFYRQGECVGEILNYFCQVLPVFLAITKIPFELHQKMF